MNTQSRGADRLARGRRCTVAAVLLLVAAFLWRGTPVAKLAKAKSPDLKTNSVISHPVTTHKVYPLSVIYGGAHSGEELARARKLDTVVARHYADFGEHVAVERMAKDTFMYVSYRKANQVYWTKTKHRIPHGELVLSDGRNLARTRCGNRLSPKPEAPVSSDHDPTEEAMDVPDAPKPTLVLGSPVATTPEADFFIPANPADVGSTPTSDHAFPLNPKNVPAEGDLQTPYVAGPRGGIGGTFPGGIGYPLLPGISGATATNPPVPTTVDSFGGATVVNPAGIAVNATIPANGVATPEPGTWPLLVVGLLLGSPALVRHWRKQTPENRRNN